MVEFNFYLSEEDYNRLYAIKKEMGRDSLTGNQFAKELLESELYRLHPQRVIEDEIEED